MANQQGCMGDGYVGIVRVHPGIQVSVVFQSRRRTMNAKIKTSHVLVKFSCHERFRQTVYCEWRHRYDPEHANSIKMRGFHWRFSKIFLASFLRSLLGRDVMSLSRSTAFHHERAVLPFLLSSHFCITAFKSRNDFYILHWMICTARQCKSYHITAQHFFTHNLNWYAAWTDPWDFEQATK